MYLREVVRDGFCEVNGRHENRGYELRPGDFVEVHVDTDRHATMRPEDLPIKIVFEDEHLLVIDKPSGMLVHPTVGVRSGSSGIIELPIGRSEEERIWRVDESGKEATTVFKTLGSAGNYSLVELEPVTGRTNQLRIHLSAIGHPIVGDWKYGGSDHCRLCLHSSTLKFKHPADGRVLEFGSDVPEEFPRVASGGHRRPAP